MSSLHPYWIVQLFSTIPHHLIFKYLHPKPVVFASNRGIATPVCGLVRNDMLFRCLGAKKLPGLSRAARNVRTQASRLMPVSLENRWHTWPGKL